MPANEVRMPVVRVLVMEDRAQVERAGSAELSGGVTSLEVVGLSVLAVDRSITVEVRGAELIDARLLRRWREKPAGGLGPDPSELRRRVRALEDELRARMDDVARLSGGAETLALARQDVLRAISEGAGAGLVDSVRWNEQLESLSAQQARVTQEHRAAEGRQREAGRLLGEAQRALAAVERHEQDLEARLALTLQGSGTAELRVTYLTPCAAWRPAYRASLRSEAEAPAVTLEAEAVVWQCTGEDWANVQVSLSTARPTLGTSPPSLTEDRLTTRDKQESEKRVLEVSWREEAIQTAGEGGGSPPELPGLDDGGEARLLLPPGRWSLPSDGRPHRLPLSTFEAPAQLERICVAEYTPLVSAVARFPNASSQVLLAGPVDLIRAAGFVGRSQLRFAAPGETVKLSFGSEDGLRVVRTADDTREESRITGRRTTKRVVTLHVSNASPEPTTLVVEERLPVSEVKEVDVALLKKECDPQPSEVSKEGIARIRLDLAPHGTRRATLAWELSAAAKVAGV